MTDLTYLTHLLIQNIVGRDDDEIIFYHLTITHNGFLINWTFVAEDQGIRMERNMYPELEIVRGNGSADLMNSSVPPKILYPNVYERTVKPYMVKAGDSIALKLPPASIAQLILSFILNGSPPGESLITGPVAGLPLVTLGVGETNVLHIIMCNYGSSISSVPDQMSTTLSSSLVSYAVFFIEVL